MVLSVVWVGFSAPAPRPPATFTYEGALPAGDTASGDEEVGQSDKPSDQFAFSHLEASYSNPWDRLRAPSKPITNL